MATSTPTSAPGATRLRRLRSKRLAAALALLLVGAGYMVFWYAATPRYGDLYNSRSFANKSDSRSFTEVMYLRKGFGGAHLVGATSNNPSDSVTSWRTVNPHTEANDPYVSNPANTVRVVVTFHVNNCKSAGDWVPVTLHLSRWWINHSQTVIDHGAGFAGPYDACRNS